MYMIYICIYIHYVYIYIYIYISTTHKVLKSPRSKMGITHYVIKKTMCPHDYHQNGF